VLVEVEAQRPLGPMALIPFLQQLLLSVVVVVRSHLQMELVVELVVVPEMKVALVEQEQPSTD
jgi:hypothetical protein